VLPKLVDMVCESAAQLTARISHLPQQR